MIEQAKSNQNGGTFLYQTSNESVQNASQIKKLIWFFYFQIVDASGL
jgi:hypothetical protein